MLQQRLQVSTNILRVRWNALLQLMNDVPVKDDTLFVHHARRAMRGPHPVGFKSQEGRGLDSAAGSRGRGRAHFYRRQTTPAYARRKSWHPNAFWRHLRPPVSYPFSTSTPRSHSSPHARPRPSPLAPAEIARLEAIGAQGGDSEGWKAWKELGMRYWSCAYGSR